MIEQHSLMNDHAQPQNNMQMNFASHQGNSGSVGGHGYTQEQIEALKRHHAQVQAGRSSDSNAPVTATARSHAGNGNSSNNSSNTNQQNGGNGPFMVLTQVAVPAHMVGQINKNMPNQLQQLLQQQQGKSSNQPQILSFNQLPPHVQQQILLQQQQQQLSQGPCNGSSQQQQQQHHQSWQQQQQQSKGGLGNLNVADLQALLKNNQIDSNLMQQILNSQMNKSNNNNSDRQSQPSNDMNDNSMTDLFGSFHDPSAENDVNSEISVHKRMFLETQVQPVHRQLDSYSDDDLFKIFDMEVGEDDSGVEDVLSPSAFSNGTKPNEMPPLNAHFQSLSGLMEPTPMLQQCSNSQQAQSHSYGGSNDQQQRQAQHASLPAQSQPQGARSPSVPLQAMATTFSLPSTMVPPTVLASVCTGPTAKRPPPKKKTPANNKRARRTDTPQDVLMRLVEKQGHPELQRIKSEDAGYDTMPSPLQLSSFGTEVVQAVHSSDAEMLGKLLACGLSPNPCNQFRDSILDLVCKRNNVEIFNCLVENGSDLRVVDGFGRTPLHHCAWASTFTREIAEAILERDPLQLFIEDKRGQTPMEYVRAEAMADWSEFLEEMADKYWPKGGSVPKLVRPKDSRPDGTLPDPKNAVPASLAAMISSGNITVQQFEKMDESTRKKYG